MTAPKAMSFDVAYMVDERTEELHGAFEGESDYADTLDAAIALGNGADCDFFIVFRCDNFGMVRTGIVYVSPLRRDPKWGDSPLPPLQLPKGTIL